MVVGRERDEVVVAEKQARCLTTPRPRTAECRALRLRRVVMSRIEIDEELHGRRDEDLEEDPAELEVVG